MAKPSGDVFCSFDLKKGIQNLVCDIYLCNERKILTPLLLQLSKLSKLGIPIILAASNKMPRTKPFSHGRFTKSDWSHKAKYSFGYGNSLKDSDATSKLPLKTLN